MSTPTLDARNASLSELADILSTQKDSRWDAVVPAGSLTMRHGNLVVAGAGAPTEFTPEDIISGADVPAGDLTFKPLDICDGQIAERLGIPVKYVRRMRETAQQGAGGGPESDKHRQGLDVLWLLDANVNTWLKRDSRNFMLRGFTDPEGGTGIARALMSDRYAIVDNLDCLLATLDGVKRSGQDVTVKGCELSERRMTVKLSAPGITHVADTFLEGYRSPFADRADGYGGEAAQNPKLVEAGLVISNSETGGGAWTIAPRIRVLVCDNGMTIKADQFRQVHLGGKLEAGQINWSHETQRANVDLIASQTADAVQSFLTPDYLSGAVERIEAQAGKQVADPQGTIQEVAKTFGFTDEEQASILSDFIAGGQATAGGVMQAVTATAQRVASPDRATEMEDVALDVLAAV